MIEKARDVVVPDHAGRAARGMRYQTYVKMLLHQALEADERHLV